MKKLLMFCLLAISSVVVAQIEEVELVKTSSWNNNTVTAYKLYITPSQNITNWEVMFVIDGEGSINSFNNFDAIANEGVVILRPRAGTETWVTTQINAGVRTEIAFHFEGSGQIVDEEAKCFYPQPAYVTSTNCKGGTVIDPLPAYVYDQLWKLNEGTGELHTAEDKNVTSVGIGTTSPKELFQLGDLFTFHDGGTKKLARNSVWMADPNDVNSVVGDRKLQDGASSCIGYDVNGDINFVTAPIGLAGELNSWNRTLSLRNTGQVVVGGAAWQAVTDQELTVLGDAYTTGSITSIGNLGVGTSLPEKHIHITGDNPTILLEDNKLVPDNPFSDLDVGGASLVLKGDGGMNYEVSTQFGNSPYSDGLHVENSITHNGIHLNEGGRIVVGTGRGILINDLADEANIQFKEKGYFPDLFILNKIGIGTANPQASLQIGDKNEIDNSIFSLIVNGKIGATAINIDIDASDWGDYVFEKGYELKSLEETESFINKNKHLPGVPSASELGEKGLDLADIAELHMVKIEELTLHLIEMKKQLKAQQELIKELTKK